MNVPALDTPGEPGRPRLQGRRGRAVAGLVVIFVATEVARRTLAPRSTVLDAVSVGTGLGTLLVLTVALLTTTFRGVSEAVGDGRRLLRTWHRKGR